TVTVPSVRRTAGQAIGRIVASSTSTAPYSSVVLADMVAAGISWRIATRSCSFGRPSKGRRTSSLREGELMAGSLPIGNVLHDDLGRVLGVRADDGEAAAGVEAARGEVGLDHLEAQRASRVVRSEPVETGRDQAR